VKRFILKVDDFRLSDGLAKFDRLIELCGEHAVPMSIGVIGGGLRGGRFRQQELFSRLCAAGTIELWNHSFSHKDMTQLSDDEIAWEIAVTNSISERTLGHKPLGFGAPFNKCDERIARIAREQGLAYTYEETFPSTQLLTPEYNVPFDGQPNLNEFNRRLERKSQFDTIIVQVHPGRWLGRGFDHMDSCLRALKDAGYEASTMREVLGLKTGMSGRSNALGAHDLIVNRLVDYWSDRASAYDAKLSNFSSYFLARFRANSRDIKHLLQSLDADLAPRSIVDVGCGLAQWGLPFFDFDKDATLWALDTNVVISEALSAAQSAKLVPHDLRILPEDFTTSTRLPKQGVDRIVCANALNYIPTLAFAQQAKHVIKEAGHVILLNQTGSFNHLGVTTALDSANVSLAKERALAELRQQLVRLGFTGFAPSRTTPTVGELEAVLYAFGFQLKDDFNPTWERTFGGQPTFDGLVFVRHSWIDPTNLPPGSRLEYRKLLCQAGCSKLDDDLFYQYEADLKAAPLALIKARAGASDPRALDASLGAEVALGTLIQSGNFLRVSQYVSQAATENVDWLLAGASAALIDSDVSAAREHIRRIPEGSLPGPTRGLLSAMCCVLDGDIAGARSAVEP
jgi:peptidoglycan/xylan/chitin deacetylase (PgdA/CDA1 family)/SAM-dependent methyltransferase